MTATLITQRTSLEIAAEWAAGFRLEHAPADVVALARLQIANLLAAMFAGSRSGAGLRAYAAMAHTMSPGPCTLIAHGDRVSLWDALWMHGVYANALELDDFHYRGHVAPASVLAPLALAEAHGLDGRAVLRAQIVASELGGRLGAGIDAEIRGGHQRSYQVRIAAAAAAGVLLGLDAPRLATAMAIAMTQPEVPLHRGMYSPDTKALSAAPSLVEGVRAAMLAAEGFGAANDILEHPAGFYGQFTLQREVQNPFHQLGESWSTHALSFKRYAGCAYAAGAIDAALAVRRDPRVSAETIARVTIGGPFPALVMECLSRPHVADTLTPVNVQFSIVRSVAHALWRGEARGLHFTPEEFARATGPIAALSARSTLEHDWRFTLHQLKGIDAGLNEGGSRGGADMFGFHRASAAFRRMFDSAQAIGLRDIPALLDLPDGDLRYFAGRWVRSGSSHLRRLFCGPPADHRPLGDLRLLSYRMGARVSVTLHDGAVIEAEQVVPTGMAGDPDREGMVREKLQVEGEPVIGAENSRRVWDAVAALEQAGPDDVKALLGLCH